MLGMSAGPADEPSLCARVERGACGRGPRKSSPYSVLVDLLHDGLEHLARVRLYADGQQQLLHDSALVHQLHQGAGIHLQDLIVASTEEHARRVAASGRIEGIVALRVYLAVGACGVSAAKGSVGAVSLAMHQRAHVVGLCHDHHDAVGVRRHHKPRRYATHDALVRSCSRKLKCHCRDSLSMVCGEARVCWALTQQPVNIWSVGAPSECMGVPRDSSDLPYIH